jgi:hypothetical protein
MSKKDGGFELKDLEIMNIFLITKRAWLWLTKESWWKELTSSLKRDYRPLKDNKASLF